ncbi:hypothetical protein BJV82DRAFT_574169 [Fennellomyces sp. T-0311]|nr:hypothetical protein BJV82DRAFT_574169 [Fennellomyces sp. T-0311]
MCTAAPLRTSCRRHSSLSAVGKSSYPVRSVVQRVASRPPRAVSLLSLWCISQRLGKLNVHRPAEIPQDAFVRASYLEELTRRERCMKQPCPWEASQDVGHSYGLFQSSATHIHLGSGKLKEQDRKHTLRNITRLFTHGTLKARIFQTQLRC